MSAFIVSTETMHRVVAAIDKAHRGDHRWLDFPIRDSRDLDLIGRAIFGLNRAAVAQRYPGPEPLPGSVADEDNYRYRPIGCISDVHAHRALSCLLYQCTEGTVPETAMYRDLVKIKNRAADRIAGRMADDMKLPWDWPER